MTRPPTAPAPPSAAARAGAFGSMSGVARKAAIKGVAIKGMAAKGLLPAKGLTPARGLTPAKSLTPLGTVRPRGKTAPTPAYIRPVALPKPVARPAADESKPAARRHNNTTRNIRENQKSDRIPIAIEHTRRLAQVTARRAAAKLAAIIGQPAMEPRFRDGVMQAIAGAQEAYLVDVAKRAYAYTLHAKRTTIQPADIERAAQD